MSRPLRKLPRIKEEHVNLSPQLRMRVRLAAQVLSTSMGNCIIARGIPEMEETATFCHMMDRWFDCLNGHYLTQGIYTINEALKPYKEAEHWQL